MKLRNLYMMLLFCFYDSATTGIYTYCHTLSLLNAHPILVVIAEPTDAITPRQRGLLLHHLRRAQVVVTQIGRHPWLVVADEIGARLGDIGPQIGRAHV